MRTHNKQCDGFETKRITSNPITFTILHVEDVVLVWHDFTQTRFYQNTKGVNSAVRPREGHEKGVVTGEVPVTQRVSHPIL